jgi:hypothetical protein
MEETIAEKDVGVTINNKLSFDKDITEKVNKANSIIGVIRRTFEYLDLKTFRMLYVSLVRPHLEYVNPVWNPYLKKHIDMIENIQRRATKLIPGLSNLSYEDRLRRLKLPSLSYRRSRGDMIEVYKIMSGKYDPEISFLELALLTFSVISLSKDSLLFIVTPTSFSAIVSSIGFKSTLRVYSCFSTFERPIRIVLHLSGWNFNIHFSNQACIRCISFCKSSQSLVLYISLKIFVSSAYKYGSLANSMGKCTA